MPFKAWYYLGQTIGSIKSYWYSSEIYDKCTVEEKGPIKRLLEDIDNKILEKTWKENDVAYGMFSVEILKRHIWFLEHKYKLKSCSL